MDSGTGGEENDSDKNDAEKEMEDDQPKPPENSNNSRKDPKFKPQKNKKIKKNQKSAESIAEVDNFSEKILTLYKKGSAENLNESENGQGQVRKRKSLKSVNLQTESPKKEIVEKIEKEQQTDTFELDKNGDELLIELLFGKESSALKDNKSLKDPDMRSMEFSIGFPSKRFYEMSLIEKLRVDLDKPESDDKDEDYYLERIDHHPHSLTDLPTLEEIMELARKFPQPDFNPRRIRIQQHVKYLGSFHRAFLTFITINFLFLFGYGFFSIWILLYEKENFGELKIHLTRAISSLFMGAALLLLLSTAYGFYLAFWNKHGRPYWAISTVLFGFSLLFALSGYIASEGTQNDKAKIERLTFHFIKDYGKFEHEKETEAWDIIQTRLKCCGVTNYTQWQLVRYGRTSLKVPKTCCLSHLRDEEDCGMNILLPEDPQAKYTIYTEGCLHKIFYHVSHAYSVLSRYALLTFPFIGISTFLALMGFVTKRG